MNLDLGGHDIVVVPVLSRSLSLLSSLVLSRVAERWNVERSMTDDETTIFSRGLAPDRSRLHRMIRRGQELTIDSTNAAFSCRVTDIGTSTVRDESCTVLGRTVGSVWGKASLTASLTDACLSIKKNPRLSPATRAVMRDEAD